MDRKGIAITALVIATIIMLANSLRITSLSILDTDPSTYVVVPLIMLPVFLLFEAKNKIDPSPNLRDATIGIMMFILFLLIIVYLNFVLSLRFFEFRIDILLLPLALSSIIIILFGIRNVSAFRAPLVYIIFGSPLLLMPIINLNSVFAQLNTLIVYFILHAFISSVSYVQPIYIGIGTNVLGIGASCAGIGALISLIFFLIPVAWLYEGKLSNKLYWIISGFALLLLLNILRMASIAGVWLFYGPTTTFSYVHHFAGILLFYISIIVMLLLLPSYHLLIKNPKSRRVIAKTKTQNNKRIYYSAAVVIVLSFVYYYISLGYVNAVHLSPVVSTAQLNFTISNPAVSEIISNITSVPGYVSEMLMGNGNNSVIIFLTNNTINESTIEFALTSIRYDVLGNVLNNSTLLGKRFFMSTTETPAVAYYLKYSGNRIYVVYDPISYETGTSYGEVAIYAIMYANTTSIIGERCSSPYNYVYTGIMNTVMLDFYNESTTTGLDSAYCFVKNTVSR